MNIQVPWNTAWTGERRYEIRPDRYSGGALALWQPFRPGDGKPMFGHQHLTRTRQAVAEGLCPNCGEPMAPGEGWTFPFCRWMPVDGEWMLNLTEAPHHKHCLDYAQKAYPFLKRHHLTTGLVQLPQGIGELVMVKADASYVEATSGLKIHPDSRVILELGIVIPEGAATAVFGPNFYVEQRRETVAALDQLIGVRFT